MLLKKANINLSCIYGWGYIQSYGKHWHKSGPSLGENETVFKNTKVIKIIGTIVAILSKCKGDY